MGYLIPKDRILPDGKHVQGIKTAKSSTNNKSTVPGHSAAKQHGNCKQCSEVNNGFEKKMGAVTIQTELSSEMFSLHST